MTSQSLTASHSLLVHITALSMSLPPDVAYSAAQWCIMLVSTSIHTGSAVRRGDARRRRVQLTEERRAVPLLQLSLLSKGTKKLCESGDAAWRRTVPCRAAPDPV